VEEAPEELEPEVLELLELLAGDVALEDDVEDVEDAADVGLLPAPAPAPAPVAPEAALSELDALLSTPPTAPEAA